MVEAFTCGGIGIDNVVAADGAVQLETMGGNAVYSAAGAKLWLDAVGIVGLVARNYPPVWLERLAAAGIDVAGITTLAEAVDCSEWFFYRADGSRADGLHAVAGAFQAFGLVPPRISPLDARRFEEHLRAHPGGRSFAELRRDNPVEARHVPGAFRSARGVHLAPNALPAQRDMARTLARDGVLVTADPGAHAAEPARDGLATLLAHVAAFLPSAKELAVLAPRVADDTALRLLNEAGAPVAVVKRGAAGCLVRDGGARLLEVPALPVVAIDPTGAGDAFCGGFLAGLMRTGDAFAAACFGTVSASFAVEAFGPFHLLEARRDEARARLQSVAAHVPGLDPATLLAFS